MRDMRYAIGGLTVQSFIELPAVPMLQDAPVDVSVRLVAQKPSIADPVATGDNWAVGRGRWLIDVRPQEAIYVRDGRSIELWSATGELEWTPYMLSGSAFSVIAYMRGRLPLHGSALSLPNGAVLILGDSGSGKSTLALALVQAGHRPMADDLCLPQIEAERAVLRPAFPRLRALPDAATQFGFTGEPRLDGKIRLPMPVGLDAEPLPIQAILILEGRSGKVGQMVRQRGAAACAALLRYRWAGHAAAWYCGAAVCMELARQIAEKVPVLSVTLPDGVAHLPAFVADIERSILKSG